MSHDTDGETALIPAEVMRYSLEKSTEVNIETSLRVLASPGEPSSSILVYFLNHRWRWCRFTSSILKTRLLASDNLLFEHNFMVWLDGKYYFLTFPACFSIPITFSNLNSNCSNSLDMRNLQEQVKKHSFTKKCSDLSLFE